MIFTSDKLKEARDAGYSDEEIWSHVSSSDDRFKSAKSEGYSLDEVATYFSSQKPVGTSIGEEISQIPAALKQSIGQPLEAIGQTAELAGFPAVGAGLKGAIQEPEGYVSAGERFMAPQEGEFQIAGFAPQYAPRAIVEQAGQVAGSIFSRIAGGIAGTPLGPAGIAAGAFAGPALFEAAQIVGPVALERAKNNGYTEPTDKDMAYAITTAAGSGLLNAFGAKYLPGGEKAVGSFAKRLASSFIGEGVPEGLQSLVQQVGETVETKKGIQVSPKQAIGEALIGGGAGAATTIATAPFTPEQIAEAKITESADKEAENLFIGNDNPQGKAVLANKQKLEQEVADAKQVLQAIEPNDPVAQKLKLELKEKEAILAAAQGQVDNIVESTNPVAEAERQQIELAKKITEEAPAPEVAPPAEVAPAPAEVQPAAPVVEHAPVSGTLASVAEAADLGYTQRDPADIRVFKTSKITNESLTNHLEKQGFREGDIIETPTGNAELYISDVGFAYSWKPKKGRGRDGVIKNPVGGVRIDPITMRDPNAPAMRVKVSKTEAPKGYVKEGGKYIFKTGVTREPVVEPTPVAEVAPEVAAPVEAPAPTAETAPAPVTPPVSETPAAKSPVIPESEPSDIPETRGGGRQFHGARDKITEITEAYYSPENIYGGYDTFYTTDAVDIAAGYQRKKPNSLIYETSEKQPVNFFNMEDRKSSDEWRSLFSETGASGIDDFINLGIDFASQNTKGTPNLREIMDEMRAESSNEGLSKDDVQEVFASITGRLEKNGFGGMQHIGGLKTNRPKHTVKIYFKPSEQIELTPVDVRGNPVSEPTTPAVSETITEPTTAPTEIAAGKRKRRKMAAKPDPIPEGDRYGQVKLNRRVQSYFGGKIPDRVYVVDDVVDEEYEYKAAYYPEEGILILNNAFIRKGENIGDIIAHELGHYAFGDKKFKEAFDNFYNSLSPEDKAKVDAVIKDSYNEETEQSQIEESKVIAFTAYTIANPERRSLWNAVLDALKAFANKVFGKNYQMSDPTRTALAILSTAKKRFAAGEEIVREGEAEVKKMAAGREQIMRKKVGPLKQTPEGIIAKTKELLRQKFNPSEVTELNTTEAYRALGKLTGKDGTAFAQELNDIGRVVDESGAASEISMGAALFINDLFEYSIRLAANGDKKLLGIMMTNINKLPTAAIGVSQAARDLRARLEIAQRFLTMAQAEQDAYTNYVAEFIYGPNPTKEQIQSIKDAYAAVDKTEPITEKELTDEIKAVGDRTGTDLVGKINDEFTKATEKKTEQRNSELDELDKEYKKVQNQADAEIEKLAKIQSDTPSFDPAAARQKVNDVRAIVAEDLKQRPDMGRKAPWKSMLVAKLQDAGVELTAAETLADIVWRQHEINNLSRELASINKAIEKGPISEIVKAIKDTPLEEQQKPNWRYEVMRDYLRKAGLTIAQSERIAKLMDISLQKRFTMAQEEAFTKAISKTAPWKSGDTRSRRAFQKVLQALRAGALDPSRNVLSDMAALNGWTGFTPEQYKTLLKNDAIISDPESADATKAEAHKEIQDVIAKAKLPIRARDIIGQYYDAQALSGIPTVTVNIFSPAGVAAKNVMVQSLNGLLTARPEQITAALTTFVDSIKSWANTVAYSFKNNVTVYSNVEYLVNDEGLLRLYKRGVDQFNNGKTARERADGVKNMMVGMMDYVRRILNALDYGAIAALQNQSVSKYALAAMQAKGMSSKDGAKMLNAMMEEKRNFYNKQIAIGTDKRKASVLADEFFISSWRQALTDAKLPAQEVMDAALNDALSSVGRNRQSLDAFREEETKMRDEGVFSFPAIWLLESMANAANKKDNQFIKIFSRVIYGFAVVPARVLRETAWFSPYGGVRFAYDAIAKKMGKASPYAQSLGNDLQYRQRLTETITGTLVMLAFGAAMTASTDDEDDEKPFKIVVTGNGPLRSTDPQFYDSWTKKNRANTVSVYFGKTKFTINTMRGFEAFAWPAMMLGAVDDWHIRRKQNRETNNPMQMGDAAIVAGNVLSASLRRGPYAFAAKPLFEAYGDRGVESLAKSLAFPAKTMIPVLGSTLASNISNFLNEPVDRRTLDGALWANVPFIGPAVAPKSLNAFGEPALANDSADKIFKLGVPIVFDIPSDRQSVMLHELVLKQGGGPSIPTRNQLAQRLDRQPTNKEYEMFVKEYGAKLSSIMKKKENFDRLSAMKPETYSRVIERLGNQARDIAEAKVRAAAKKP